MMYVITDIKELFLIQEANVTVFTVKYPISTGFRIVRRHTTLDNNNYILLRYKQEQSSVS